MLELFPQLRASNAGLMTEVAKNLMEVDLLWTKNFHPVVDDTDSTNGVVRTASISDTEIHNCDIYRTQHSKIQHSRYLKFYKAQLFKRLYFVTGNIATMNPLWSTTR